MTREESLGKRLLSYLGLKYRIRECFSNSWPVIDVFQPQTNHNVSLGYYSSWHNLLFGCPGQFGLCHLYEWLRDSPRFEYKLKAFRFENLDELEMQLSIRGF